MEGPSLLLAAEQLAPFVGYKILKVSGNTKIGKERLKGEKILAIFSYGKYLFFQFETFALRVHFLLYGSFEAIVDEIKVTGDYPAKNRPSRLSLELRHGLISMYSCSIHYIEEPNAKDSLDYSVDIMSDQFDEKQALQKILELKSNEIADVLLDQTIFKGVGNIIKNESLYLAKLTPETLVQDILKQKLKQLIKIVRDYVFKFYEWRKIFELKKHYQVYRQSYCKGCENKIRRKKTGFRKRISFICDKCQK